MLWTSPTQSAENLLSLVDVAKNIEVDVSGGDYEDEIDE